MSETLSRDLLDQSATELVAALAARQVSAAELTDQAIARIEARDGPINAVVVRDFDRARTQAKAADAALARGERGALLGLPMTVKESHNVAGLATTWGFEHARNWIAPEDAVGVARLKAAGAVILGKTNVPVSLADWQSVNPIYGRTNNPPDLTRSPGGSSGGGAAAVAAGMVPLEFGSDIGGSIRVPAAFCGLFGHKPSYGLVPTRGHAPPGVDGAAIALAVVGPLARTAADLTLALGAVAGPERQDAKAYRLDLPPMQRTGLADYRVLILDTHPAAAVDSEIRAALDGLGSGLARLGAYVTRSSDRLPDLAKAHELYGGMMGVAMSRGGPEPSKATAHEWMGLLDGQEVVRRAWAAFFREIDIVLAPTMGAVAFPHVQMGPETANGLIIDGQPTPYFAQLFWPGIATLANLPATAIPIGQTKSGLPIGAQVIGPYLEDLTTIGFAGLVEREFGGFVPPRL